MIPDQIDQKRLDGQPEFRHQEGRSLNRGPHEVDEAGKNAQKRAEINFRFLWPKKQKQSITAKSFLIKKVATLQAASNFGVSESPRLLACAIESRAFGPKPKVLE